MNNFSFAINKLIRIRNIANFLTQYVYEDVI